MVADMRKMIISCLAPLILLGLFVACGKKHTSTLNGKENGEQAFKKCLALSTKKKFQEAIDCLEIFKNRFSDSEYALEAELRVADAYYQRKEYLLAAESYQAFAKLHSTSDKLDYAYYRTGLAYLHETPKKIDRDQEHLPAAVDFFSIVFTQFPTSPYAKMAQLKFDEVRLKIAERHFYVGKFYYKRGEYTAAIPRFREVYEKYSHLGLDEDSLYYLAACYQKTGKLEAARGVIQEMKTSFPESEKTRKISKEIL